MKIQLEPSSGPKQLRMCDLKPGDVAEILENDFGAQHAGKIITVCERGGEIVAFAIGSPDDWWNTKCFHRYPVRLLTPGECIRIVE